MCSDTCQTTSHGGSQDITVKDEEGFDGEVREGPEAIKAESEVSFVSVL
jgi:hypothetical protein